ncbi:transcription elongation factor GreA [Lewinellaceae bacterium SD302]|nr:transcription elongation factor GreA [Lewinellaceae bacterium SD302]
MSGTHYMSQEGYDALVRELDELKTVGRSNAAKAIAEAREKGDLSENAEYDAAKDAQGMLEMKINQKEKIMANARVLDTSQLDASKVTVMSKVTIKNIKNNAKLTYQLVSQSEANLAQKKISVDSPMGEGLLGKAVGDKATVITPNGEIVFEILDISL